MSPAVAAFTHLEPDALKKLPAESLVASLVSRAEICAKEKLIITQAIGREEFRNEEERQIRDLDLRRRFRIPEHEAAVEAFRKEVMRRIAVEETRGRA